jgi:tRNA modification GTPase
MLRADRILYVIDATRGVDLETLQQETSTLPNTIPVTWVFNKIDLAGAQPRLQETQPPSVHLSATTGDGVELLREHLKNCMGYQAADGGAFSARRRHLDALARAQRHLNEAASQLVEHRAGELMAEELRQAQQCLAEITGEFTSDDLLGRIFASFCIGK